MEQIPQYAWVGALLFARLGALLMLAPGWGEQAVPAPFRLSAALLVTFVLASTIAPLAPTPPPTVGAMIPLIFMEAVTGLILGGGARLMMSALQVAGSVAGIASGLGFAQQVDPISASHSAIFSSFLSLIAIVLLMTMGLHRVMISAVAESYQLFPPGGLPPFADVSLYYIDTVANAFRIGVQIAAPVLVFSIIFNVALGLASRLIPQVQMYLIAMPMSVMLGVAVFALGFGGGLMVWLAEMDRQVHFFAPR